MDLGRASKAFLFYAIALGLAILVRFAVPLIGEASLPVTMLTPAIAAAMMLAFVRPEGGFRDAVRSLGLTSPGLKGWPLAVGAPLFIHAAGLVLLAATGLTAIILPGISSPGGGLALDFVAGLFVGTAFALFEEVGWRGYMLPRMAGFGTVSAMLAVGFLHGVWHLPLLLTTGFYHGAGNPWIVTPLFLATLTLAGVFYGFLRIWTGSVWPVAIAHMSANLWWDLSTKVSQTKSAAVLEYIGGESGVIMICGLLAINALLIRAMRGIRHGTQPV
jgi:uncharacterized protein